MVRVTDLFQENDTAYLVMELVAGKSLRKELDTQPQKKFSPEKVREIIYPLVSALSAVHQQGIFHLDIKPDNILLTPEGRLVLIDFGSAKQTFGTRMGSSSTRTFTENYAAPEVIAGGEVGVESDIFEVGMMVYEMLTGQLPPNALQRLLLKGKSWQPEGLQSPWQELVMSALVFEPESRPRNIQEWWEIQFKIQNSKFKSQKLGSRSEEIGSRSQEIESRSEELEEISAFSSLGKINLPLFSRGKTSKKTSEKISPFPKGVRRDKFSFEVIKVDSRGKKTNRRRHEAEFFTEDLGRGVVLEMVYIPGGSFLMGSPKNEAERYSDESPQHEVTLQPFFMSKYPITQNQYQVIMGKNPSRFKGGSRPVERVSWHNATEFCQKLSKKTGKIYTLPSESQWEYACRAGTTTPFYFGETITSDLVNYNGNFPYGNAPKGKYRKETTDVGSFPPNAFGLYDMHGNVWEWCLDIWHDNYDGAPTDGSAWETGGDNNRRLLRGGSWINISRYCRCARRNYYDAVYLFNLWGFRIVSSVSVVSVSRS
ncbi:bifunctional serine/threonine-protein kinase/formylglycine-generating enzyme family protein [Okeania sp. SIO3I5]|uniref:bifunctional serine/threonine-protein kinase/formylglycine-generating enzyme family protein n=1 Tax=Okeania sp. SIO3I5 TaxID=2607805 RepID=UPI0034141E66